MYDALCNAKSKKGRMYEGETGRSARTRGTQHLKSDGNQPRPNHKLLNSKV